MAPKMLLSPGLLLDSGVQPQTFPLTHIFLDRYHGEITVLIFSILFIQFVVSLQTEALYYQFKRFGLAVITSVIFAGCACALSGLILYGRYWAILLPTLVAINDTMAYFADTTLGSTPLLKMNPNTTVEGFVGGLGLTLLLMVKFSNFLLG